MSFVGALFCSLVHSIWQGLVLHAGGWALARRMRSAPQRYLLLCGAQLALVVVFVATLLRELERAQQPASSHVAELAGAGPAWLPALMSAAVWGWACGLALMTLRLARGFYGLRCLRRSASPLGAWQAAVGLAAARFGIRRAVSIVEAAVDSPLALGWLRPIILLPLGWAAQLPAQVVEAAILHELVHIRRHDFVVNIVQHLVEALFFFHPSVWWLSRRVRYERELCCDQVVADAHLDPLDYAAALLALEQRREGAAGLPAQPLGVAMAGGELKARIEHVLARRSPRLAPVRRGVGAAVTVLVLASVAALGACMAGDEDLQALSVATEMATLDAPVGAPRWLPDSITRHAAAVEVAAAAHAIDPALVWVVLALESGGDPEAQSPGGALGLMQLMPTTAVRIAAERGLPAPTPAQLRDPAYNVDFGAYYLAQQLASFGARSEPERVRLAAIAYNAGPAFSSRYIAGLVELYPETALYSQLVSTLWSERDAVSSPTYQALVAR